MLLVFKYMTHVRFKPLGIWSTIVLSKILRLKKKKTEKHIQYPRSTVNVLILKILLSEQVNSVQGISTPDVQYFMRVVLT